jgi:catechol 2,3-dioxygenase-like lactoylglutathione lyase family enzyme
VNRRAWCAVLTATFITGAVSGRIATQAQTAARSTLPAENVTGIGGVFFKAKDPEGLTQWYRDHLGVDVRGARTAFEWRERDDPARVALTVWAIFPETTKYFSPGTASFMVNYRVRDLDRMVAQLRAHGISVDSQITEEEAGRFTWVVDPEGNRIELWEPRR